MIWIFEKSNTQKDGSGLDIFFFKKDNGNIFAVFPQGGFGHGMQNPDEFKISEFKNKKAKMLWYDDYPFPLYVYVTENLPENWGENNLIEIKIANKEKNIVKDLEGICSSFQFLDK